MRAGALISAVAHAILLTLFLLGTAKPFDSAPAETVTVDLVPSAEAPPEPAKPEKPPEPEAALPTKPELEITLPSFTPTTQTAASTPSNIASPAPTQRKAAAPAPAASKPQSAATKQATAPVQPPQQPQQQQQPPPQHQQQAPPQQQASLPPQPQAPPQPPSAPEQKPAATPSIFDPASIPKLMDLAPTPPVENAPSIGFDAPADARADLSHQEVAAFKTHLKKCLKLPDGVDPTRNMHVVMRVFLKPDGALASDPMLIEASAAREGPAVVQAAERALKACQPYDFLPADKYREWKILDLTLSPRDMAGG